MKLSRYIKESQQAETPRELFKLLCEAAHDLGFPYLACVILSETGKTQTYGVSYPQDWINHYLARNYQNIDPVLQYCPRCPLGLEWKKLRNDDTLTAPQKQLMQEAEQFGLERGLTLPLFGPYGRLILLSFAGPEKRAIRKTIYNRLMLLALQFHICLMTLNTVPPSSSPLTPREIDCLKWVAQGKSSWEIGKILGISEHTVNGYIRDIYQKLDVSTRAMAVMTALRRGLMTP
ncbi:LuxR family transcriptional regulator [Luteithermobacter gelatinilyticus]|uniref:LuxR family transcriptional regulator n=1 Tax=Luteithermobacter gelatinilyticus TaxID=2582913 RepID=UPI001105B6D8|nr:LuxR family transcriptional regulator [Luteithermobacter gelatinilyticus]